MLAGQRGRAAFSRVPRLYLDSERKFVDPVANPPWAQRGSDDACGLCAGTQG